MSDRILQAIIRVGRTIGAAAVAAALLAVADFVTDLQLGPIVGPIALLALTALLNGLGKLIRGPDVPVAVEGPLGAVRRSAVRSQKTFFVPI